MKSIDKSIYKSLWRYLTGAALGLLFVPTAYAQTTYGAGTCAASSDMMVALTGTTQLSVGGVIIPQTLASAVFNQAECQCHSRDIGMHFVLTQGTGFIGAPVTEMWIGEADCSDYSGRSLKVCDQVDKNRPANNDAFNLSPTSFQTGGMFDVSVPPEVVTNPKPTMGNYICSTGGVTNTTISVMIGPPTTPAICTLPVAVNTQGPAAPQEVGVTKGDGALVVNWTVPANTTGIDNYQVLCRKQAKPAEIAMGTDFLSSNRYYFSSCINGHLFRRRPGDLNIPNDDATSVGGVPIDVTKFPIDPRLRCSGRIAASANSLSTRLTGLDNGTAYDVMVVSIDPYGNATPSAVVTAAPQKTADVLNEYCDGADCPGFGCQAGRGAATSGRAGAAAGLLALGLLAMARRARRVA